MVASLRRPPEPGAVSEQVCSVAGRGWIAACTHVASAGSLIGEAGAELAGRVVGVARAAAAATPAPSAPVVDAGCVRSTNLSRPSIRVTFACSSDRLPSTRVSNCPNRDSKPDINLTRQTDTRAHSSLSSAVTLKATHCEDGHLGHAWGCMGGGRRTSLI
jgi:hypothetical protein